MVSFEDFLKLNLRVGRIKEVHDFPEARVPAYKLLIDFGPEIGLKKSSAQITHYSKDELLNRQVVCVCGFPPKQVGPVLSEVLVLGALDKEKGVVLLKPDKEVSDGDKVA
ncbi:MAG: tRNA-binding protein [Candidatus Diapherotrites archaeon]|nr:tRNA-binding protein [Candidatus Diapherotrites archaeon]